MKILIGIITVIIFMIGLVWFAFAYSDRTGGQNANHASFQGLIKSTLRMPENSGGSWFELIDKNEWYDLEPISEEEWQDVKCKFTVKNEDRERHFEITYGHRTDLSEEEKRKRYCISGWIETNANYANLPNNYKDYLNTSSFFGDGWYAPCLRVYFHEYVLQHPKILRNILKIAERPCDYTKNLRAAICVGNCLSCYSFGQFPVRNERTCSIINIISANDELLSQIVVPRKDNKHLFNKE